MGWLGAGGHTGLSLQNGGRVGRRFPAFSPRDQLARKSEEKAQGGQLALGGQEGQKGSRVAVLHPHLAMRCRPGLAWLARSIPTAPQHPARSAPSPGRVRRRTCARPGRRCSRGGRLSRGKAACGRGHCASWPALPPWGWRASGSIACGLLSCAMAGRHC